MVRDGVKEPKEGAKGNTGQCRPFAVGYTTVVDVEADPNSLGSDKSDGVGGVQFTPIDAPAASNNSGQNAGKKTSSSIPAWSYANSNQSHMKELERKYSEHVSKSQRQTQVKMSFQGKVYNFLERPSGWKCFAYHFLV